MTNTASKSERAALAGSNTATTLFQQASAQLALEGTGRFAALSNDRTAQPAVAGTEPFVRYPGGASWTRDQNMLEPPLGYSVDALEPVGEAHEIAKSAALGEGATAELPPQPFSPPSTAATVATPAPSPGDVARGGEEVAGVWPGRVSRPPASPPSPSTAAAAHERLAEVLPKMITRRGLR